MYLIFAVQNIGADMMSAFAIGALVMLVISAMLFAPWAYDSGVKDVHREAVKAGVAQWSVNRDGAPVFQWKKIEQGGSHDEPHHDS